MAWTVPTYHHVNALIGDPPAWRYAMRDLCLAVNQRENSIAVTKTQFYKGDGTLGSDLVISDFQNLGLTHSNTNQNLRKVRDFIKNNCQYFTRSSGISDVWTLSDLEDDIADNIDINPSRPLYARYWQAMQDALDRLTHARRKVTASTTDAICYARGYPRGIPATPSASLATAWSNLLSTTDTSLTQSSPYFSQSLQFSVRPSPFGGGLYDCISNAKVESLKFTNAFSGVATALQYEFGVSSSSELNVSADITCGGMSPIDALDYRPGNTSPTKHSAPASDLPIGGTGYVNCEIELPSSYPFSTTHPVTSIRSVLVGFGFSAFHYFDLSSVLTDQT